MYTTIEADVENGQIQGPDAMKIPRHAHVLITLLTAGPEKKRADWNSIKPLLGKLKLRGNTLEWQRRVRSEWE